MQFKNKHNLAVNYSFLRSFEYLDSWILFLTSSLFFYCLATFVGAGYEGLVFNANDIIFSNDAALRMERLNGVLNYQEISLRHPLKGIFWGVIIQSLSFVFALFGFEYAVMGSIIFLNIAALSGSSVVINAWMRRSNIQFLSRILFVITFTFISSNIVLLSPDHFTFSFFLMLLSIYIVFTSENVKSSAVVLLLLMFLIVGTTTSNLIFCFLLTVYYLYKHSMLSRLFSKETLVYWLTAFCIFGLSAFYYVYSRWERLFDLDNFTLRWLNFRLIEQPFDALYYSFTSFYYPIVAPLPNDGSAHFLRNNVQHLCMEPWGLPQLSVLYLIAVFSLTYMYFKVSKYMLTSSSLRPLWCICVGWVLFNCILHNLWGDEFFLYTSHWSFALLIILMFAPIVMPSKKLLLLMIPILFNQIYFYLDARAIIHGIYNGVL